MPSQLRRRHFSSMVTVLAVVALAAAGCGDSDDDADGSTSTSSSNATEVGNEQFTPIVGSVEFAPVPFEGSDGKVHLVYELSVTNFTSGPTKIEGLKIVDEDSDKVVGELTGDALNSRVQPAGSRDGTDVLDAGQAATIFLHVTLDKDATVPDKLVHEVAVNAEAAPPGQNRITERLGEVSVDDRTLPVLSAPLRGERYIAADGCCDAVRHTRAILPVDGQTYVAQRYAIDYEQADEEFKIFTGDPKDPKNYEIFGKEVYAVADGTVVGTKNDLPEQEPGTFPSGISLQDADGNYVVLDIGNGFYVNYAHMQPGSVKPKVGDKVTKGDVIGLVGNTGNSVAPHLHLHVMNGPSPLASQGLPAVYEKFAVTAQVASTADFDASEGTGIPLKLVPGLTPSDHEDEMILDQNLVTFTE